MPTDDAGWIVVNVLAPPFLPLVLLGLVRLTHAGARVRLMETLKDGQLCWFTIAICCATGYDLWAHKNDPPHPWWCGACLMATVSITLFATVLVISAGLQPTPLLAGRRPVRTAPQSRVAKRVRRWLRHYIIFVASAGLAAAASTLAAIVHIEFN